MAAPTKVELSYQLTDTLTARAEITRGGQNDPSIDDQVYVIVQIFLPRDLKSMHPQLHRELVFQDRVEMVGQTLVIGWGLYGDEHWVTKKHSIDGTSWAQLFRLGRDFAEQEIGKLTDALRRREQVLRDAELDPAPVAEATEVCPHCLGEDKYCLYCQGAGVVPVSSAAEWREQNPTPTEED